MCGIAGIYTIGDIKNLNRRILSMTDSIAHRGPDSGASYISPDNKLALGHRRLSIIDLREVANQPMTSSNKEWHVVFNGEIYNFLEIKGILIISSLQTRILRSFWLLSKRKVWIGF